MLTALPAHADFQVAYQFIKFDDIASAIVAVSGGGDSMALLLSLVHHIRSNGYKTRLVAVTVDHSLRTGSAKEAQEVNGWCQKLGVEHIIQKWEDAPPASGLQAAAREARYKLLADAANKMNAQVVFTGHTMDDQLETLAMRGPRGEGSGRGMAGIQEATLYKKSLWFVRPLLAQSREDLRAYLMANDQAWIDDPSNENEVFERVAIRKSGISEVDTQALMDVRDKALAARITQMQVGADVFADAQIEFKQEKVLLKRISINEIVLQTLLSYVGQKPHFASPPIIKKAMAFIKQGKNKQCFTAHGCLLRITGEGLEIMREERHSGDGQFGFDYLIQSSDFALASAFLEQIGAEPLPICPIFTDRV